MIVAGQRLQILIATRPVDFRCGHRALALIVQTELKLDPSMPIDEDTKLVGGDHDLDSLDILMLVTVHNRGPEAATLHVLPQLWFRNIWTWRENAKRARMHVDEDGAVAARLRVLGDYRLYADGQPDLLFTENETNLKRLYGVDNASPYVKDAFHEYLIDRRADAVNPQKVGSKVAAQ